MELPLALALIAALLTIAGLIYFLHARIQRLHVQDREIAKLRTDLDRFRLITDVEAEVARMRSQVILEHQQMQERLQAERNQAALEHQQQRAAAAIEHQQMQAALANEQARVHAEIAEARRIGQTHFDQVGGQMVAMQQEAATLEQRLVLLRREAAELDDQLMFAEHGLYQSQQIVELEAQLLVAGTRRERAISRAQQFRSGHVYVISNIGSFGEDVYKIGMTRRENPDDRVKELGDASVPFRFDVHAMIYCDDAPALETKLHRALANYQVNLVNSRKEFYRITLAQVEAVVGEHHGKIQLTHWAEAEEYRKTEALRQTPRVT